jgi:hypothetical protein
VVHIFTTHYAFKELKQENEEVMKVAAFANPSSRKEVVRRAKGRLVEQ